MDTNILLDLYRRPVDIRDNLLNILTEMNDRLWIPHQVAYEFFENRPTYWKGTQGNYQELIESIEILEKKLSDNYNKRKENKKIVFCNLSDDTEKTLKISLEKCKQELIENEFNLLKEDTILTKILSLYENKVGNEPSKEELTTLFKEGKERYDQSIPPGYKDKETKKDKPLQKLYGDYILWNQVLNKAKSENKNIILVTGEEKEDWWLSASGKKLGPRIELIKEFNKHTENKQILYMYRLDQFIGYAKDFNQIKNTEVKQETIDDLKSSYEDLNIELYRLKFIESTKKIFINELGTDYDSNEAQAAIRSTLNRLDKDFDVSYLKERIKDTVLEKYGQSGLDAYLADEKLQNTLLEKVTALSLLMMSDLKKLFN